VFNAKLSNFVDPILGRSMNCSIRLALLLAVCLMSMTATAQVSARAAMLVKAAPTANPKVIELAVSAIECAAAHGMSRSDRLAIIDYSLPSTQPRLWVFDLNSGRLLYRELVAHGRNSGDNYAQHFSNGLGSLQSSLGLFRTLDTYTGNNGYSLRMDGLDVGFNDKALQRAIVMHGAPYVDVGLSHTQGRIGRSWGCPAVNAGIARQLIDTLKGGQFIFSYYPDRQWLAASQYLHCDAASTLALNNRTEGVASRR
jgi:hypothetical protein